jgi:1-aminocyclopropane-1-carboxylate deaminase
MESFMHPAANTNWQTFHDWHFGGFGKHNTELIAFLNQFYEQHRIPLDFVYEGKMMFGLQQLLQSGYFPKAANLLCLHCGGLQGNASISHKLNFASII